MARIKFNDLIVFESKDFLAINKPANVSSLHERVPDGNSIYEIAQLINADLQLCHRIDKETTGVLLISKNPEAYRYASGLFAKRKIKKIYHAVSEGFQQFEELEVNYPLASTRNGRSVVNSLTGKESQTIFNTLERFEHYTLVEALPHTGRLHQIRAHLAAVRAPIAADQAYGGKLPYLSQIKKNFSLSKGKEEQPMINRVALHARSLVFNDPNGNKILIEAPYPKDYEVFLKLLRKYDASKF